MIPSSRSKRRYRRIAIELKALVDCDGTCGTGRIRNLSREGLFVCTQFLPEPDEPVRVVLETPNHRKVEVHGRVRWTTSGLPEDEYPRGFGLRIEDPGPHYADFFEDLALRSARAPARR